MIILLSTGSELSSIGPENGSEIITFVTWRIRSLVVRAGYNQPACRSHCGLYYCKSAPDFLPEYILLRGCFLKRQYTLINGFNSGQNILADIVVLRADSYHVRKRGVTVLNPCAWALLGSTYGGDRLSRPLSILVSINVTSWPFAFSVPQRQGYTLKPCEFSPRNKKQ